VTFSHQSVIDLIRENYVAVWESVAPVRTATFDLGGGKSITGTTGGELAIFFCTKEGWVYDLLPALHSPAVVHQRATEALDLYRTLKHTTDVGQAIQMHHALGALHAPRVEEPEKRKSLRERWRNPTDGGTGHLQRMVGSKASADAESESIVVVDPGGFPFYRPRVHDLLSDYGLCTPLDLRKVVFETILNEPLDDRGEFRYSFDVPRPFTLQAGPGDLEQER